MAPGWWWTIPTRNVNPASKMECNPNLLTRRGISFKQGKRDNCMVYALANGLAYCGFMEEGQKMLCHAKQAHKLPQELAFKLLCDVMEKNCPLVGRAIMFNTPSYKKCKLWIGIEDLLSEKTPFPNLVVPLGNDGSVNHACCVADDLIFDSTQPKAMKLLKESFDFICGPGGCSGVYKACWFQTKVGSAGVATEGKHSCPMIKNC